MKTSSPSSLDRYMQLVFYDLGYRIGSNPWRFILVLLLITAISSLGLLQFTQQNNARQQYTSTESPSRQERAVLQEFLRQNGSLHMIQATDGGNLLRVDHLLQLFYFTLELTEDVKVVDDRGRSWFYGDLCEPYCEKNQPLLAFLEAAQLNVSVVELRYPIMRILGAEVFIGGNIYDVILRPNTTLVEAFHTAMMPFFLVHRDMQLLLHWETQIRLLMHSNKFPLLRADASSDNLIRKEIRRMGTDTAPMLAIALALLLIFLFHCSFRVKLSDSKPIEAVLGGLIPILAGITTVGLVSALAVPYQSIVIAVLFLMLAIGVDDVYIMLAAWHRSPPEAGVAERVAITVRDAGGSMTITTITNLLSFGVGLFSTTPALRTFAIYAVLGTMVCFVYQLIIFAALLALGVFIGSALASFVFSSYLPDELPKIQNLCRLREEFLRSLARLSRNHVTHLTMLVVIPIFLLIAGYGIHMVKTDISVQKIAMPDSYIIQFKKDYDNAIKAMQTVVVVVNNPGNLSSASQLGRVWQLVQAYESASFAYGNQSTVFWLNSYIKFMAFYDGNGEEELPQEMPEQFSYLDLPAFLQFSAFNHFQGMVHINESECHSNRPTCITSFIFTTGFTNRVRYTEMLPLITEWREINEHFSDLNVSSYNERADFADQTLTIGISFWQTLVEALCLSVAFLFFVPSWRCIVAALCCVVCVNVGVVGFISLWGIDMDPLSMASLMMSIGFSVDIIAHVAFHFHSTSTDQSVAARLETTLLDIGWPMIQGGLSTLIAMAPVLLVSSYLGLVFFKTLFLVVLFGLVFGLFVLPALIFKLDQCTFSIRSEKVSPTSHREKESRIICVNCV